MAAELPSTERRPLPWEQIESRVARHFDTDHPGDRHALAKWHRQLARVRGSDLKGAPTDHFDSPKAVESLVAFFIADVADNRARYDAAVARRRLTAALFGLEAIVAEHDAIFISLDEDDDDRLVPELGCVVRNGDAADARLTREVVEACRAIADDQDVEVPDLPDMDMSEFAADLRTFLDDNNGRGHDLVRKICDDTDVALQIEDDDDYPTPIRYLAELVVKSHTYTLPDDKDRMGFGPSEQR